MKAAIEISKVKDIWIECEKLENANPKVADCISCNSGCICHTILSAMIGAVDL